MARSRTLLLWVLALASVLSYALLSSSKEFSAFAPLRTSAGLLYGLHAAAGFVLGFISDGFGQAALLVGTVTLVPLLVYGVSLVALPAVLSGTAFLDALIFWALQRMLIYMIFLLVTGTVGAILGTITREFARPAS